MYLGGVEIASPQRNCQPELWNGILIKTQGSELTQNNTESLGLDSFFDKPRSSVATCNVLTRELLQMQLGVRKALVQSHQQDFTEAQLSSYEKKIANFQKIWNGDLAGGIISHDCYRGGPSQEWCCKNDKESKSKLADALCAVAMSSPPETPAPGKWTKLWSSLQFLVFSLLCNSILPNVVDLWFAELKTKQTTIDADIDPALAAVEEWARITGKRAAKSKDFFSMMKGTQLGFKLITLAIVDEPVRFLTYEFLKLGDKSERDPPLSTLVHDATSPLKAASQYLASLLLCKNERLALVHQSEGSNTIEDWELQHPQQVRSFRRLVLLCVAWLQRRHFDRLLAPPFGLSCLGDSRISQDKKEEIAAQWDSTNPCCVRPGMARKLKARGICGTDLLSSKCPAY